MGDVKVTDADRALVDAIFSALAEENHTKANQIAARYRAQSTRALQQQLAERDVALQQISQWVRHYKKNSIDSQRLIQRIGALTNLTKDQTDAK